MLKPMKITRSTTIFLLLLFALLSGCKKRDTDCPASQDYTYNVSKENRSKVPYKTGYETLTYISDSGDTAVLHGQGIKNYYVTSSDYTTNNPDCGGMDEWHVERIDYSFEGDNLEFLKLSVILSGGALGKAYTPGDNTDWTSQEISTKDKSPLISYSTYSTYSNALTDTIIINSKAYSGKYINDLFYSYQNGVLRFNDTLNHKVWTLQF
jgi:hypothetical protein